MNKYETTSPLYEARKSVSTRPIGLIGGLPGMKCVCNFPKTKEGWNKFSKEVFHKAAQREIPKAVKLLQKLKDNK